MSYPTNILSIARNINEELRRLCVVEPATICLSETNLYDEIISNRTLRKTTEKLFKDGHHARAVEEAYKLLDNLVKKHAGISNGATGARLMQSVFSADNPVLKLNEGVSDSEKDEQKGYMQIFSGCMTGIRNPRAHESDWEDTEQRALQLLALANHLIERVMMSEKVTTPLTTI